MTVKKYYEIPIDYSGIKRNEITYSFNHDGSEFIVSISVNPNNMNVLFSLFIDRKDVIVNKVVVSGERILSSYGLYEFYDKLNGDFVFSSTTKDYKLGNIPDYNDLGTKLKLYMEVNESEG